MKTLATDKLTPAQLDALDEFARTDADPELRDVLLSLSRSVRDGDDIIAFDPDETLTPSTAAERLRMSRTHLYKLLDSGEIPSERVGRDRRIRMRDLVAFEAKRQRDRRELAERFAHQSSTADAAIDEIADLL